MSACCCIDHDNGIRHQDVKTMSKLVSEVWIHAELDSQLFLHAQ